jgi:hypothetical protein
MTTHESSTRTLLRSIATGDPQQLLSYDALLDSFSGRAFGMVLLMVTLPTLIPVPVGIGAVSGFLVALVGIQIALQFVHPWLPAWLRRRGLRRERLQRFIVRIERPLGWVERWCRPRLDALCDRGLASACTGVQLILIGMVLMLPIPFTNIPIGFLLLVYCFALIERDGALMLTAWVLGTGTIAATLLLSNHLIDGIAGWLH